MIATETHWVTYERGDPGIVAEPTESRVKAEINYLEYINIYTFRKTVKQVKENTLRMPRYHVKYNSAQSVHTQTHARTGTLVHDTQ